MLFNVFSDQILTLHVGRFFSFYRKAIPANNARNVTMVTLVTLSFQEAAVNHALATATSTHPSLETVTG